MAMATWAGTIELVSSALALFVTPEDAEPFLLWVLRLWANLRAMPAIKEDQHSSEME